MLTYSSFSVSASSFADVVGMTCQTAIEVLSSLDIVKGKTDEIFEPDSMLTRAEMVTIVLRMMGMHESADNQNVFEDLPSSHWAYANISAAYRLGIINGTSETTFEPDKAVTYEQAVKMVVSALGYTMQAEAGGGYPSGYLSKASQLDILKGVKNGGDMTRGNMAILVYNALDVPMFMQNVFGDAEYAESDETILSHYLKVEKYAGKALTTTAYAQPDSRTGGRLRKDEVALGESILNVGETNAQEMFGIRSDIYTREVENSENPVILAIVPRTNVEVIDLQSKQIDGTTTQNRLVWTGKDGKVQKTDLTGATLFYNGCEEEITVERLMPAVGTVRLILDNSVCKNIIVEEYTTYLVDSVLLKDMKVRTKNGSVLEMDIADKTFPTFLTDSMGTEIGLEAISEWNILSVCQSLAGNATIMRRVYCSDAMISGTVTELLQNMEEAVVAGTNYKVVNPLCYGTVEIGTSGAFYLDFMGNIAAVDEEYESGGSYGWLVNATYSKGLSGVPQFKIFTQDGEMQVFKAADFVSVNGNTIKNKELLLPGRDFAAQWTADTSPTLLDSQGNVVPQLLKYTLNNDNALISIDTAMNTSDPTRPDSDKIQNTAFGMDWFYNNERAWGAGNAVEFNGTKEGNGAKKIDSVIECIAGVFFGKVWTDGNTKLFVIPTDPTNEKGYNIRPLSSFGLYENREAGWISFYDVDETYYCNAMVMHNYLQGDGATGDESLDIYPNPDTTPALVLGRSTVLGEDGETENVIRLYNYSSKEVTATVDEEVTFLYNQANADINADKAWYTMSGETKIYPQRNGTVTERPDKMYIDIADIDPGDVIQYELDASGKLVKANVLFRHKYACQMELLASDGTSGGLYDYGTTEVNIYFGAGKLLINGKVIKTTPLGPVVEVHPAFTKRDLDGAGRPIPAEGLVNVEKTFIRTLNSNGRYVVWDTRTNSFLPIKHSEVLEDDMLFSYWNGTNQWMVVVYR